MRVKEFKSPIPNPGSEYFSILDPVGKKAPHPEFRSESLTLQKIYQLKQKKLPYLSVKRPWNLWKTKAEHICKFVYSERENQDCIPEDFR
jgi:hypothetical protein